MKIVLAALLLATLSPLAAHAQEAPRGWEIEAAETSQGVFDPGVHLFSSSSWIPGGEIRVRRDVSGESALRVAPEASLGLFGAGRTLEAGASSTLWLRRGSVGARVTMPLLAHGGLSAFARAGATMTWASAAIDDPYQKRSRDVLAPGALVAGGLTIDAGPLTSSASHLLLSFEAGHSATTPMAFGRWGKLEANGVELSGSVAIRF